MICDNKSDAYFSSKLELREVMITGTLAPIIKPAISDPPKSVRDLDAIFPVTMSGANKISASPWILPE